MKVLMYEHTGRKGLFIYTRNISEGLAKKGCDISLLTTTDCIYKNDRIHVIKALKPVTFDNWLLKFKPFWALESFYRACNNSRKRMTVANSIRPDIVHLQLTKPLVDQFFLPLLSNKFNTVLTVHDVRYHSSGNINNRKSFLRRTYSSAHHIIVHTINNKNQMINEFSISPENISVIPHGTHGPDNNLISRQNARDALGIKQQIPVILFFGNIRENKGLDLLIKAFPSVLKSHSESLLLIAGSALSDESAARYLKLIKDLNLSNNAKTEIRFIEESEVAALFRSSDIIVLPYKTFSSQSGVLLQSYKYGRPVVVTDTGGLGEAVTEDKTGVVVKSTAESISSGIIRLINDRDLYDKSSKNMLYSIKDKYHWDIVSKKTMELYGKLLTNKS